MIPAAFAFLDIRDGDEPWLDEMAWATPQYSRNQVDKAGFVFTKKVEEIPKADLMLAYDILSNWRASHSFPL